MKAGTLIREEPLLCSSTYYGCSVVALSMSNRKEMLQERISRSLGTRACYAPPRILVRTSVSPRAAALYARTHARTPTHTQYYVRTDQTRRFASDLDASAYPLKSIVYREPCIYAVPVATIGATAHPCGSSTHPRHVASRDSPVKISVYHPPNFYQMRLGDQQGPRKPPSPDWLY